MQVLVVDDVLKRREDLTIAMLRAGYQVTSTASETVAEVCVECTHVDLLIAAETVGGKRTHSLALLAEYKNPLLATVMMTPRVEADVDELYELLPSVDCIVGMDVPPEIIRKLADASVKARGQAACASSLPSFMRRREVEAEEMADAA